MNIIESQVENSTKNIKLYSIKSITGATFFGGPLVAGYLINKNYKALERPNDANFSLIVGIIATILLFAGLYMTPAEIIESIPSQLVPAVYTGIIWGLVEWKQGEILRIHKENNNNFYSGWSAAGIGLISLLIVGIGILGYAYLLTDNQLYNKYDSELTQFAKNEKESLNFYEHLDSNTSNLLIQEIDEIAIPKWRENIDIVNRIKTFENLPSELLEQNNKLLEYCELRIQAFQLFRKSLKENTGIYALEIEQIHLKIDEKLKQLN